MTQRKGNRWAFWEPNKDKQPSKDEMRAQLDALMTSDAAEVTRIGEAPRTDFRAKNVGTSRKAKSRFRASKLIFLRGPHFR
jgi:hypothetical protein